VSIYPGQFTLNTNIAGPDFDESVFQRLACCGVNDTNVKEQVDAALVLADVIAHELVVDVVRAFGNFGCGYASRLIGKVSFPALF
jgi:hypothetical protein